MEKGLEYGVLLSLVVLMFQTSTLDVDRPEQLEGDQVRVAILLREMDMARGLARGVLTSYIFYFCVGSAVLVLQTRFALR